MPLTLKDPKKFIGDQNFIVLYLIGYLKKRTCRVWVEKGTTHSWNINCFTCFYCMQKGHTSNKCRIKHFDVPNERCAWIPIIK